MREWIGSCQICGKEIHCEDGFFNGVVLPGHEYRCFECDEKQSSHKSINDDT